MIRDLEKRFQNAQYEYDAFKRQCETQVVQWRWASWQRYSPIPYYFKRYRFSRGYWLKREPARKGGGVHQYGFDRDGRIVVIREPLNLSSDRLSYEEFFDYTDSGVHSTLYHYAQQKDPINVAHQHFEGGRLACYETVSQHGCAAETYVYRADRLVDIQTYSQRDDHPSVSASERLTYDRLGRLASIVRVGADGLRQTLYRRPQKGETIRALVKHIESHLMRVIPQMVRAAAVRAPVYCLALSYDLSDDLLPITLGLGLERERELQVGRYGFGMDTAKYAIWGPAEFAHYGMSEPAFDFTPYLDANTVGSYDLLNQQLHLMGTTLPAEAMLNRVAVRLMKQDWSGLLNTTSDFVVYAVDYELRRLEYNLEATMPEALLNHFHRKGYL